jgi:uncharacterized membrane protein YdbT with pleckstrin-like domain
MPERFRRWLLRILRVPAEPAAPAGAAMIRVFRAAPAYFRYRLVLWMIAQVGALVGLIFGLVLLQQVQAASTNPLVTFGLRAAEAFAWITFLVQIPFSLAALRLDFDMRWYILADRSLRIREGIFSLQEKTMTFANIQQVTIRQNPLQRLLGISDVQVRSAGGGSSSTGGKTAHVGEAMHEAYFRGVDNADEIRTVVRERVRRLHPATPPQREPLKDGSATSPESHPVLLAARELRSEIGALARIVNG